MEKRSLSPWATALCLSVLQACGGSPFSSADDPTPEAGADSGAEASGQDSQTDGPAVQPDAEGGIQEAGPDNIAPEASTDAASEAAPDAAEEETGPDAPSDAAADDAPQDAAEEPDAPWPSSPCGPIPPTGYAICWIYAHPGYPTMHVGLAGGVAKPGHFIENEWQDPMSGNAGICVAATPAEDRVVCTLDELPVGTLVQFAAGLHLGQNAPTDTSHWACDAQQCHDEAYAYHDGVEIGKYVGGQGHGKLHTIPHFVAAPHIDLGFNITQ